MSAVAARTAAAPGGLVAAFLDLPVEVHRRQPHLAAAALLCLAAIVPCLIALSIDVRTVNGISVWIKPTKFLVSFVVYYATLAWVFGYLPRAAQSTRAGRFVIWAALLAGAYEMAWLLLAAASGVPAHFNVGTRAWALAYQVAGVGSVLLIAAILVQGVMVARQRDASIPAALRTALVLGAVIAFAVTLVTAGFLSAGTGHWVGGLKSDAGGLPLVGWSRTGGDLRVAHFWALHSQQFIPLVGLLLVAVGRPRASAAVVVASIGYVALIAFTFVQALGGEPFLRFLG
jgi:hypothetical protein